MKQNETRDDVQRKRKPSNGVVMGLGVVLVSATAFLSVLGANAAVNAFARNSYMANALLAQQNMTKPTNTDTAKDADTADATDNWNSEQIKWMLANHITYNEDGCPVNEAGTVMDDPTTLFDETKRVPVDTNADGSAEVNPETNPEESTDPWYQAYEEITVDGAGIPSYVVQPGDSLSGIANAYGFRVSELADYNNIANTGTIVVGQLIQFPLNGPVQVGLTDLGLG